jgi:hypothetical protein
MTEPAGADYCVGINCGTSFVTVKSITGQTINISPGCQTTCEQCQPIACTASCIAPQHMKAGGESITWDGTYYVQSTCTSGGQTNSCRNTLCAAPGMYVAHMCASKSTSDAGATGFCMASPTPTCVDVPFVYPSATTVDGMLPH